jgi:HEAT repeat protein
MMTRARAALALILGAVLLLAVGCDSAVYKAAEKGDVDALVAMAEDVTKDQYAIREVAVEQLGNLGTPEAVDALLGWIEEGPPPGLEDDVLAALGATGDPRAIEPLLAELDKLDLSKPEDELDDGDVLKIWMIMRGFANLPDQRVADRLLAELDAGHAAAISETELMVALAGQGEAIAPALEQRLASSDELVFGPASSALASIYGDAGNNARIAELLAGPTTFRIYEGVLTGFCSVEPQAMIDSLNTVGDVRMAQAMLNSGVEEYEAAATRWATANGYMISTWITTP